MIKQESYLLLSWIKLWDDETGELRRGHHCRRFLHWGNLAQQHHWGWIIRSDKWKESWWTYYLNDKNYDEKAEIGEKSLKCRFSGFWSLMVTFSGQWRHRRRTSPLSLASLSRICRFTVGKCLCTGFPMLQNLIGQIMMLKPLQGLVKTGKCEIVKQERWTMNNWTFL